MTEDFLQLLGYLAGYSLMAIGGVNVILAELHRLVVATQGWMTAADFATLFALAQASPGPNTLFVSLIGWHMAGIPGGVIATVIFTMPPVVVAVYAARLWNAWGERRWFRIVQLGLAPLTIGLMVASAWLLINAAAVSWVSYAITAAAAATALATRAPPVAILAVAALIGVFGLV